MSVGARIHITTGDIGCLLPKLQGRRWRMIHPPTHLHYFTQKSLTKLLETQGLRVIQATYPAVYRSLRQIWYSLFSLNKKNKATFTESKKKNGRFIGLNTFDILFIVAEK